MLHCTASPHHGRKPPYFAPFFYEPPVGHGPPSSLHLLVVRRELRATDEPTIVEPWVSLSNVSAGASSSPSCCPCSLVPPRNGFARAPRAPWLRRDLGKPRAHTRARLFPKALTLLATLHCTALGPPRCRLTVIAALECRGAASACAAPTELSPSNALLQRHCGPAPQERRAHAAATLWTWLLEHLRMCMPNQLAMPFHRPCPTCRRQPSFAPGRVASLRR